MERFGDDLTMKNVSRRSLLKAAGTAGAIGGLPEAAVAIQPPGPVRYSMAESSYQDLAPTHRIKFGVIGIDHIHINGITDALRRGGGELMAVYSNLPSNLAAFQKRYPGVKAAATEEEIFNDPSIQLVASAAIPDLRANRHSRHATRQGFPER